MASHQDEAEAGPSGLSVEEMLALLGLDTSEPDVEEEDDSSSPEPPDDLLACHEVLGESDSNDLCHEALDRFERQRTFQTHLLQQSGGGLDSSVGTFDFDLQPYVDRQSSRMGVRERHFQTPLRQTGNFIDDSNIVRALQEGLRRAVDRVLTTPPPQPSRSRPTLFHAQFQSSDQSISRMGITCGRMARRRRSIGCSVPTFGASSQQQRTI